MGNLHGLPSVVIAIPTFRRPDRLADLLEGLPRRIAEAEALAACRVLIVDNDPEGSAEAVAHTAGAADALALTYVREDTPGIAAARSRALAESATDDLLAFIDDDEVPREGWLSALLETHAGTGASAVMGRVVTRFPDDVDPWVLAGGYFQRPSRETGTRLPIAATGNLLLDLRVIRRLGLDFDDRLGLAGGEDSVFTRELVRRGGTIVWCQESVAVDHIEPDRLTRDALLRRAFAHGNVEARIRLAEVDGAGRRVRWGVRSRVFLRGLARVVLGSARTAAGRVTRNLAHDARGRRTSHRGAGMLSAARGTTFEEYRR
ncbi:hypothetical protein K8P10_002967 [Leucobacter sp. Psy1]|uniref:glycosyltransferase family 2 protein n=1 Tax=Leucobacter sp. Psy1 TaxID=2875729 RepID=UPI001CD63E06|nr:glycosyltransferase [Leucobacter sp. Psy1]UBH07456.1 hypothetical protein K8P10_002967 [Leucobacter sp. Psy1]